MQPTRRGLFGMLAAAAASAAVDPERLLWTPGKRLISIPKPSLISFTAAEWEEAYRFYVGQQWPEAVRLARLANGRPCLTVNLLGPVMDRAIADRKLVGRAREAFIVGCFRGCRDSQMTINYLASTKAELCLLKSRQR